MHLSLNPLFRLSDVLCCSRTADFQGIQWSREKDDRIVFFSRGQWALKELGSSIIRNRNKAKCTILIPEYFCEISLTPMRSSDFNIFFYRITADLEPDIEDLDRIADKYGSPDILVFVHYFGIPLNMDDAKKWCEKKGVAIVEDAAHSLLSVPGIGDHGCPSIYTPWKFLNLPGGALVVLPVKAGISVKDPAETGDSSSYPAGWILRQTVSGLLRRTGVPVHKVRTPRIKKSDESEPYNDPGKPQCMKLSKAVILQKSKRMRAIGKIRERNYRRLDAAFTNSDTGKYRIFSKLPANFTPYIYPLRITGESSVDFMSTLNRMGIPAQPWSDLSPEVKGVAHYYLSNALRREVMVLPVHQDLSVKQIDWMAEKVIALISQKKTSKKL